MSETTEIYRNGKYCICIDGRNYTASEYRQVRSPIQPNREEIDSYLNTYHITLSGALLELSRRMLNDKISKACKDKPMDIRELADTIKEHNESIKVCLRQIGAVLSTNSPKVRV